MIDNEETEPTAPVFDPTAYPEDTLFHERRHRTRPSSTRDRGRGDRARPLPPRETAPAETSRPDDVREAVYRRRNRIHERHSAIQDAVRQSIPDTRRHAANRHPAGLSASPAVRRHPSTPDARGRRPGRSQPGTSTYRDERANEPPGRPGSRSSGGSARRRCGSCFPSSDSSVSTRATRGRVRPRVVDGWLRTGCLAGSPRNRDDRRAVQQIRPGIHRLASQAEGDRELGDSRSDGGLRSAVGGRLEAKPSDATPSPSEARFRE